MKIATWNVNSLKVRLPQVLDWLKQETPDVLCLQELKMEDKAFPVSEIEAAGYSAVFSGQKTYNGVAILVREPLEIRQVVRGIEGFEDDQQRVISATVAGVRVVCVYVPNGQSLESDKYQYKLRWLDALERWLMTEIQASPHLALLGDYNIAPEDRDVHDPVAWRGQILCSEPERAAFRRLLDMGLVDAYRCFDQPEKSFSWWDYRMMGFRRNQGLRIDHILLSSQLAAQCSASFIDKAPRRLERPSDHAPVVACLRLSAP